MVFVCDGLRPLQEYLLDYASSEDFRSLVSQVTELRHSLAETLFSVIIRNLTVKVKKYENERDYSHEMYRFSNGSGMAPKNHFLKMPEPLGLNHVEAQILDRVAVLFPSIFGELKAFCASHAVCVDETLDQFDREIQFHIAYLDYIEPLRHKGLSFCLPDISRDRSDTEVQGLFDLALAKKLAGTSNSVVANNCRLEGNERMLVITGPNQGGKTTSARAFGQIHHLASIGLPVPGSRAQRQLFDSMHTHFEKEETIRNQRGKLHEELVRHWILDDCIRNEEAVRTLYALADEALDVKRKSWLGLFGASSSLLHSAVRLLEAYLLLLSRLRDVVAGTQAGFKSEG